MTTEQETTQQIIANSKSVPQLPEVFSFEDGDYIPLFNVTTQQLVKIKKSNIVFTGETVTTINGLTDTPSSKLGQAGKVLLVSQDELTHEYKLLSEVQGITAQSIIDALAYTPADDLVVQNHETRITALEANPTGKPPVDAEPYADVAALLTAQNTQEEDYFYEVTDASGFTDPDITTGNAVVLLTKTPGVDATGTEADYIVVWAKEFELGGGATYDDTAIIADLATKEKKRNIKIVPNTTQYTFVATDFTDDTLVFTANAGETISVILNPGVAPIGGQPQMVSIGDNKLAPSVVAGVTASYPEGTNPTTILRGWLGGVVTDVDTISYNGSLESTETGGGIEEAPSDGTPYSRQDAAWVSAATGGGATLTSQLTNDGDDTINPFIDRTDVFTNSLAGTVPAPNVSSSTVYGGAITFPTEGFTVTEGDTVSVTASESAVVTGVDIEVVTTDFTGGRPWKKIKDIAPDLRLSNVAADLNATEQDAFKAKMNIVTTASSTTSFNVRSRMSLGSNTANTNWYIDRDYFTFNHFATGTFLELISDGAFNNNLNDSPPHFTAPYNCKLTEIRITFYTATARQFLLNVGTVTLNDASAYNVPLLNPTLIHSQTIDKTTLTRMGLVINPVNAFINDGDMLKFGLQETGTISNATLNIAFEFIIEKV